MNNTENVQNSRQMKPIVQGWQPYISGIYFLRREKCQFIGSYAFHQELAAKKTTCTRTTLGYVLSVVQCRGLRIAWENIYTIKTYAQYRPTSASTHCTHRHDVTSVRSTDGNDSPRRSITRLTKAATLRGCCSRGQPPRWPAYRTRPRVHPDL